MNLFKSVLHAVETEVQRLINSCIYHVRDYEGTFINYKNEKYHILIEEIKVSYTFDNTEIVNIFGVEIDWHEDRLGFITQKEDLSKEIKKVNKKLSHGITKNRR